MNDSRPATPPTQLVSVYEAVNDGLKEIYLGTTTLLSDQLVSQFQRTRPSVVAHWKGEHKVYINIVEYSIPMRDVESFISHYSSSAASAGWKTLRERA